MRQPFEPCQKVFAPARSSPHRGAEQAAGAVSAHHLRSGARFALPQRTMRQGLWKASLRNGLFWAVLLAAGLFAGESPVHSQSPLDATAEDLADADPLARAPTEPADFATGVARPRFPLLPSGDNLSGDDLAGNGSARDRQPLIFTQSTDSPEIENGLSDDFGQLRGSADTGAGASGLLTLTPDPGLDLPVSGTAVGTSASAPSTGVSVGTTSGDREAGTRRDQGRSQVDTRDGRSPVDRLPQRQENPTSRLTRQGVDTVTTGSIGADAATIGANPRATAVGASAARVRPESNIATSTNPPTATADDTDPFAAVGLRVGSFDVFPAIDSSVGYTTNRDDAVDGTASATAILAPEIEIRSDWERHSLTLRAEGVIETYFDSDDVVDWSTSGSATATIDVTDVDRIDGGLTYNFYQEDSSEQGGGVTVLGTDVHTFDGILAYERDAGLVGLRLGTEIDYSYYDGGETVGGAAFTTSSDRTNALVRPFVVASLNPGAVFEPFVELGGRGRFYQNNPDSSGFMRNALGFDISAGVNISQGSLFSGFLSAGFLFEAPEDSRLENVQVFTIDGNLTYAPSDVVTFAGTLSTDVDSTTLAGSSASITYRGELETTYAVRDNLDLSARTGGSVETYSGDGTETYSGNIGVGALYRVNRMMQVYGTYDYTLTNDGTSYDDHTVEVGVRLQH